MSTDFKALCAELLSALENEGYAHWVVPPDEDKLCLRARTALAQPEPSLTVEDCNNMRKHAGNYIAEDFGGITLDGYFTREDLIEIANTVPR